jgi:hypothetical protein
MLRPRASADLNDDRLKPVGLTTANTWVIRQVLEFHVTSGRLEVDLARFGRQTVAQGRHYVVNDCRGLREDVAPLSPNVTHLKQCPIPSS